MKWFTADLHFGHANIVDFCKRPFLALDGRPCLPMMHDVLTERWNSRVKPEDTVYVLGDFAFGPAQKVEGYLRALTGKKVLIRGNHDRHSKGRYLQAGFDAVYKHLWLGPYFLIHRGADAPLHLTLEQQKHTTILCGHVHERWQVNNGMVNVGVDVRQFTPVSLEDLGLPPVG